MSNFFHNPWVENFLIPALVFCLFFLISVPLTRLVFRLLQKASQKAGKQWGQKIDHGFHKPLRLILVVTGIYVALSICPVVWGNPVAQGTIVRCFRSFLVIAITWGFCRMADVVELGNSAIAKKLDIRIDKALTPILSGVLRFLLIALAVLIVAQEWNFSISGLLAGLGLGGLAFALAAKDMLSNLFGGLAILLDHPFSIGDWIRTGKVEGVVEDINFRSLKVRTGDQALVTVPNSITAAEPIYNFSRMGKRHIEFPLTLKYSYSADQLEACAEHIRRLLKNSERIENGTSLVTLNSLDGNGPTFTVSCYALVTDYNKFLQVRGKLNYSILKILEEEKISLS